MDTGSYLMWVECQECKDPGHHSFHQNKPVFNHSQSSSHRKLVCDRHPLCFPGKCIGNFCSYHIVYDNEATTEGYLASKTFTFESNSKRSERVWVLMVKRGNVAGILGSGWSPHSLVSQFGSISEGWFSHCLQRMPYDHHSPNTYLRFGADTQ
ncbi:hypothetical protein DVH24_032191 [Malus domestica]|uniref:Peptidase A1 domain-containing protein n=1 Tax=Malus domestica TaxID=3750 RepID=A0A498J6G2_MALDO|nr:hypothetical protein DVH24_032191 [Malus domestica]